MHGNTGQWCRKEDNDSEEELESNDGQNTANQVGHINTFIGEPPYCFLKGFKVYIDRTIMKYQTDKCAHDLEISGL